MLFAIKNTINLRNETSPNIKVPGAYFLAIGGFGYCGVGDKEIIMNKQEFELMAESWYQRTHRLREYSEDESKDREKRSQAFRLFLEMTGRMLNVARVYSEITMPPPPKGFKEGAYTPNPTS